MGILNAAWIMEKNGCEAPVFRKRFNANGVKKAVLDICGLGWYELYINGERASEDVLAPATSTYAQINGRRLGYPINDIFLSPRTYYCRHDVSHLIHTGTNLIAVMLGNGWFNQYERVGEGDFFNGSPRLAFSLELTMDDGSVKTVESGTDVLAGASHIVKNNLYSGETQVLSELKNFFSPHFNDWLWENAVPAEAPEGELTLQTCLPDRIIRTITPKLLDDKNGKKLYDLGENITGYIEFSTSTNRKIVISHSEELGGSRLDFDSIGGKNRKAIDIYYGDGKRHEGLHPHFNWHGFRYFTVRGDIENPVCRVIHTDMPVTSGFESESEVLNWLYSAFIRTQLDNTHACVPSDCPHRERLGYTGDGQLCCESVMTLFDARKLYDKWMQDIVDCQCVNGHVQHTAPFFGGGGGPCGWGGAVIVVPYFHYLQYGDKEFVKRYYSNIKLWFEYIEDRCENGLVGREEKHGWCLGDWCVPDIEQSVFPADYVNTCLLIKFYGYLEYLEKELGIESSGISEKVEEHKKAVKDKYFTDKTGSFCSGKYGADAFAVDIGLGDRRTLRNLKSHYDALGCFDTGIFGTDILLRVLFENGMDDTALRLMMSQRRDHSFGYMMNRGATTIWEYFNAHASHNHPMFGACVKLLPQYVLGIRSTSPGFRSFIVSPTQSSLAGDFSGHITTPLGKISVSVKHEGAKLVIRVEAYDGADGVFRYKNVQQKLHDGVNEFSFKNERKQGKMRILFQGDSITDMGRDRSDYHDMGEGYPLYSKELLKARIKDAEFINLGISGDRTISLVERWDEDCIKLQPDIVSIMIGINDTWRAFDSNDPTSLEAFEDNYRNILERTKRETDAKILILEPFLTDADGSKAQFRADLDPKILIVRKLAMEYADAFIPLDGLIAAASVGKDSYEPAEYVPDSVHPSPLGAQLIAGFYASAVLKLL